MVTYAHLSCSFSMNIIAQLVLLFKLDSVLASLFLPELRFLSFSYLFTVNFFVGTEHVSSGLETIFSKPLTFLKLVLAYILNMFTQP